MSIRLPPLPEASHTTPVKFGCDGVWYTSDQMREYAADEITSLRTERDQLRQYLDAAQRRGEELRAQVAALEVNAGRYRFFRNCFTQHWQLISLARRLGVEDQHFEPSLDAAIDAALEAFEATLRWIDDYCETTGFETVEAQADAAIAALRARLEGAEVADAIRTQNEVVVPLRERVRALESTNAALLEALRECGESCSIFDVRSIVRATLITIIPAPTGQGESK